MHKSAPVCEDLLAFHRQRCPCNSSPCALVGLSQTTIEVLACLGCGNVAAYRCLLSEPNKGDVIVRYEAVATTPEVLQWLAAFPRQVDGEFFPASTRGSSFSPRIDSGAALDRFIAAGLPGAPPEPLPPEFTDFEQLRVVCQKRHTASFNDWVSWSLFHPASPLARELLFRRPRLTEELVQHLRARGRSAAAVSLLRSIAKRHPIVVQWLQDEARFLETLSGVALTEGVDRLAHDAKSLDAFELAPYIQKLQSRLDSSAPAYIRTRIARITAALFASAS